MAKAENSRVSISPTEKLFAQDRGFIIKDDGDFVVGEFIDEQPQIYEFPSQAKRAARCISANAQQYSADLFDAAGLARLEESKRIAITAIERLTSILSPEQLRQRQS